MSLIYIYKDVNNITNDPVITDNVKVKVLRDQDVNKEERKAFLEFRDHGNVESVAYMHTNESWHDIYNYRYVLHEIFKAIGVEFSFDHCDLDDYMADSSINNSSFSECGGADALIEECYEKAYPNNNGLPDISYMFE